MTSPMRSQYMPWMQQRSRSASNSNGSAPPREHQQGRPGRRRHKNLPPGLAGSTLVGVAALGICSTLLLAFYYVFYTSSPGVTLKRATHSELVDRLRPTTRLPVGGGRRPENSLWKRKRPGAMASMAYTRPLYNSVSPTHAQPPLADGENNVYKSADLNASPVSEAVLRLADSVDVEEAKLGVTVEDSQRRGETIELRIFYRESRPPPGHHAKGEILLLHGQAFTGADWLEHKTMQVLAAAGYRVCAVDLPGYGQTGGRVLTKEEKPWLLAALVEALSLRRPILVSPSMSGAYSVPYFMSVKGRQRLAAFVPVAPVGVTEFTAEEYEANKVPTLMIYGERDTSLGVLAASHLRPLANGRVYKVPAAGHACYLNNPAVFHAAVLNFLDLVHTYGEAADGDR